MPRETEAVDRLVQESSYAFKATVRQINASNEPSVRGVPGLIVAHVDEAFRASPSVGTGGLRGREVTIRLAAEGAEVGEKLILFATEWVYGINIALREIGRRKATREVEREVVEAVERLPIRHLESRLDGGVRVIEGEVREIKPSPIPDGFTLRSPNYHLAVVKVVAHLKGKGGESVSVLFPTNPAPPWRSAPRLKLHQKAVFILRHETALKAPAQFFTALDPADVQQRDMVKKIKDLLKEERS